MSFSIIQTIERGKKALSVVPSGWLQHKTLFWPKKISSKKFNEIVRDKNSVVHGEYVALRCTPKRFGFLTYEDAEIELEAMMLNTDSDAPIEKISSKKLKILRRNQIGRAPQTNFNDVFASLNVCICIM